MRLHGLLFRLRNFEAFGKVMKKNLIKPPATAPNPMKKKQTEQEGKETRIPW
jgi:hypothetical protein